MKNFVTAILMTIVTTILLGLIYPLVVTGLVIALVIGFFGGLLPAWRAARMPVTAALRAA